MTLGEWRDSEGDVMGEWLPIDRDRYYALIEQQAAQYDPTDPGPTDYREFRVFASSSTEGGRDA